MKTDMKKEFAGLSAIFCLVVILLLSLGSRISADETTPVTCYKGESRIGTVTAFDWRTAAAICNSVLYDCRGACIGCFSDFDYINDVCVDARGSVFLR